MIKTVLAALVLLTGCSPEQPEEKGTQLPEPSGPPVVQQADEKDRPKAD